MKKGILAIIVILALVAGGVVVLTRKSNDKKTSSSTDTSSSTPTSTDNTVQSSTATAAATITYGDSGFGPATVTVKAGETVEIKNTSSHGVQVESDPHPNHTDNPEFNVGSIVAGGSATITVKKVGTWGYHNHLNSSETGNIVIQ